MMTKRVIVANETSTLYEAAQIFVDENISHLPIMRDNNLVGLISKTDVLKAAGVNSLSELDENKTRILSSIKISQMMKKPIYIYNTARLHKVKKLMKKFNINSLPVLNKEKRVVGIITKPDLMKTISKSFIGTHIETANDEVLKILEESGSVTIDKLAKTFTVKPTLIEEWGEILEEHDLATVVYPTFGKPYLKIIKKGVR